LQTLGLSHHLRHDGALYLYEGAAAFAAAKPVWDMKAAHGVEFEPVSGARLAELQPGLGATYTHAMYVPHWLMVSDPYDVTVALGRQAFERGATFVHGEVTALDPVEQGVRVQLADGQSISAKQAVIAAGAWSKTLTGRLGDRIPLEAERGYNTTLPADSFDLRRQLVLPADGYVITPLATGIRVGGAAEFAGLHRAPDYRRSAMMLKKSQRVMTGLKTSGGTQWMGARPSLPDSLPVIGRSPANGNIFYAFGHGHLGLTQSAATARIIRDLALDRQPPIDCHPYRPERFH
jgi:D-amino-acid dehydrogenase